MIMVNQVYVLWMFGIFFLLWSEQGKFLRAGKAGQGSESAGQGRAMVTAAMVTHCRVVLLRLD